VRNAVRLLSTAVLISLAAPAEAHLVTTGLGPVYDGIVHLVMSPADVGLVIALALVAGMRGPRVGRSLLAVLPTAWLAGGAAGLFLPGSANAARTVAACFLLVGALVARDRNLSVGVVTALAAAVGALQGFLTSSAFSTARSGGLELLGGLVALLVVVTLVTGAVVSLRAFWARIVVRVLGSCIAATGLLMFGWTLRGVR
jgi:hypothetical protein